MYIVFDDLKGSNPYIATTNKGLFDVIMFSGVTQYGERFFVPDGVREWNRHTRQGKKDILRAFAIEWQNKFSEFNYDMETLVEWQGFFEEYGRKYGLLKEFRENGIL